MKCEEVCAALEEYFDGELEARRSAQVSAHLSACRSCAAQLAGLQSEQDLLLRYARDVAVTPELWRGVQTRIAAEQAEMTTAVSALNRRTPLSARLRGWLANSLTVPRFSPALTAALVLVAIALTVGVMTFANKRTTNAPTVIASTQTPSPAPVATLSPASSPAPVQDATPAQRIENVGTNTPTPAPKKHEEKREQTLPQSNSPRVFEAKFNTSPAPTEQTPDALVRDAEAKYQKAIEILTRDAKQHSATLDPQTVARYDDTLKALDRTIAETRAAALKHNSDPVAVQYMLTAYAKKVEVLREMARN